MTDELNEDQSLAQYWCNQIEKARKHHRKFFDKGDKIIHRYKDERPDTDIEGGPRKINLLWSNVETLKPTLYAQSPKPEVGRRFKDSDPVGKVASTVLERSLEYCNDVYDFDGTLRLNVQDYLLPGRGQAWVKYGYTKDDQGYVANESAKADYVHWKDFLTNPARTWDEVWWVAKRSWLTRKEGVERFGKKFNDLPEDTKKAGEAEEEKFKENKFPIWEIWSKRARKVIFICESYKEKPLEVSEPFVNFRDFFPCPRPLTTTTATDSIIPTADYVQYQDQAEELDQITGRISLLVDALRVVGVYDASAGNLAKLLQDGTDNELVPIDNWASFAQKGGMPIAFLPIKEIAEALMSLYEARDRTKNDLYEVTGLGDIIRGASDPRETARAQEIKSQWGSIRVRDRQHEVQRYARDLIRLKAEVIAEHFSMETLRKMTGVKLPTAQEKMLAQQQAMMQAQQTGQQPANDNTPTWEDVIALLRDDLTRTFRIDIETDSTILADEQAEKQARTEFVTAVTQYLTASAQIVGQAPEMAPLMGEMLLFAVRAFKVGEQLEETIEKTVEAVRAKPQISPEQMQQIQQQAQALGQENEQLKAANQKAMMDNQQLKMDLKAKDIQAGQTKIDNTRAIFEKDIKLASNEMAQNTEEKEDNKIAEIVNNALIVLKESMDQNAQAHAETMNMVAEAVTAPRKVEIVRDKQGKAAGGISRVVN